MNDTYSNYTQVLQAKNAGVRRPGYEARGPPLVPYM